MLFSFKIQKKYFSLCLLIQSIPMTLGPQVRNSFIFNLNPTKYKKCRPQSMTELLQTAQTQTLTSPSNTVGNVFCMTVDEFHAHQNSSVQSSVSTISTFIDELALEEKVCKKGKTITKTAKKAAPANWTKDDISNLVVFLKRYGSDFTMISTKMNKTRDQIKRKFKVLEKKWPKLAEMIFQKEVTTSQFPVSNFEIELEENDFFQE